MSKVGNPIEFYKRFRFTLTVDETVVDGGGGPVALMAVWSDVFHRDQVWLVAGHAKGRDTLMGMLRRCVDKKLTVTLFDAEIREKRSVVFTYDSFDALPFDLDAREEGEALEAVVLRSVRYRDLG